MSCERFKTMIGVIEETEKPNLDIVCSDIRLKDSTFNYKIVRPKNKELIEKFKWILVVFSDSQEMANKRGGWLIHKMKDAKVSDYFWVKECKNHDSEKRV